MRHSGPTLAGMTTYNFLGMRGSWNHDGRETTSARSALTKTVPPSLGQSRDHANCGCSADDAKSRCGLQEAGAAARNGVGRGGQGPVIDATASPIPQSLLGLPARNGPNSLPHSHRESGSPVQPLINASLDTPRVV